MALFDIETAIDPAKTVTPAGDDYVPCFDESTKSAGKLFYSAMGKVYLNVRIPDISTAGSDWVVSPVAGTITKIWSVIHGTIATADAGLSFELGGTAITGGGITVAYSGSAAGDVDSATPTALNTVAAGGAIECITDGASTNAIPCDLTIEITPA